MVNNLVSRWVYFSWFWGLMVSKYTSPMDPLDDKWPKPLVFFFNTFSAKKTPGRMSQGCFRHR